jgi:hypothetical protein
MILILPGERSHAALEACLILARQLAAHGYPACIDAAMLPDDLTRGQKYEAAIFALDPFDAPPDQILLIAAQRLAQDTLDRLRHLGQGQTRLQSRSLAVLPTVQAASRHSRKWPMPWGANRWLWIWTTCRGCLWLPNFWNRGFAPLPRQRRAKLAH